MSSSFVIAQSVDIPNTSSFYAYQKQSMWCWAACNQMLLNSQGINETQENQVVKLFGSLINQGAGDNYEKAKLALGGMYKNVNGNNVTVTPYVSYGNLNDHPAIIIKSLQDGIPLVMATRMHGRVCVGVDYIAPNGVPTQITVLRLLNPASQNGIETKSIQEFNAEGLMGFMTLQTNNSPNPVPDQDDCPVCGTYGAPNLPDLKVYVVNGKLMADGNGVFQLFPDPQRIPSKYVNQQHNLAVQFGNNYSTATIFQNGQIIPLKRK